MTFLNHRTVYQSIPDDASDAVNIPLIPELLRYQPAGEFVLLEDPRKTKRASIIGMFVLRPATESWNANLKLADSAEHLYDVKGWSYNIKGLDGSWLIANGNVVDAYRLALQYGLADAVLVGSTTVATEGIMHEKHGQTIPGHVWHPYNPAHWPQLRQYGTLLADIAKQRKAMQADGLLSERIYPAQIVVTPSGKKREGRPDILDANIFDTVDDQGNPIEAYIVTSQAGRERIQKRAEKRGFSSKRIDEILIALSPAGDPESLDLSRLPALLFTEYDIRIANHDGGAQTLKEFNRAGVLPQMNLTFARGKSLYQVLQEADTGRIPEHVKHEALSEFGERVAYFFSNVTGQVPRELTPVQIIQDEPDEVAIITLDARKAQGF